jgi:FKBP-type peptidyl-prolyl cis-trans isomerase
MQKRTILLALGGAFAVLAAACGADDPESPAAPTSGQSAYSTTGGASTLFDESKATTAESGLRYIDEVVGTGDQPSTASSVLVHYRGQLTDGAEFDSSYGRGAPAEFPINGVIAGFSEGLLGMKEGGRRVLYIPWQLGYGEAGYPGVIPGKADLIFTVELIEVR